MTKEDEIQQKIMSKGSIKVTSPLLPDLNEFTELLKDIWSRKWITNNGQYHEQLEQALAEYLKVPFVSLFTNGTLPIITALQALGIKGEVITTPYSFVATTHALWWNGIKPVFVDIDPTNGNIDPTKIEAAITSKTTAIMPVHVYGNPCDIKAIQDIADKYHLKVIYDAAHAFGVEVAPQPPKGGASECAATPPSGGRGASILLAGDISTMSFHATKVFTTIEGGAMIMHDSETKQHIDHLKNFGFAGETEVVAPGINSKMDEVRAAFGLLNLKQVDAAIEARRNVAHKYVEALKDVPGIRMFPSMLESFGHKTPPSGGWGARVRLNYGYFPIFVDAKKYGMTRDNLYFRMQESGIYGRRYFYPLISTFSPYRNLESASPQNLPVATRLADEVICLPMHHELSDSDVEKIIDIIIG